MSPTACATATAPDTASPREQRATRRCRCAAGVSSTASIVLVCAAPRGSSTTTRDAFSLAWPISRDSRTLAPAAVPLSKRNAAVTFQSTTMTAPRHRSCRDANDSAAPSDEPVSSNVTAARSSTVCTSVSATDRRPPAASSAKNRPRASADSKLTAAGSPSKPRRQLHVAASTPPSGAAGAANTVSEGSSVTNNNDPSARNDTARPACVAIDHAAGHPLLGDCESIARPSGLALTDASANTATADAARDAVIDGHLPTECIRAATDGAITRVRRGGADDQSWALRT